MFPQAPELNPEVICERKKMNRTDEAKNYGDDGRANTSKENSPAVDISCTESPMMQKQASNLDRWLIHLNCIVGTLGVDVDAGLSAPETITTVPSATRHVNKPSTSEQ